MNALAGAAAAFAASAALTAALARSRARFWPRDTPTERSLHALPTPRTGGLAILGGLAAALPAGPAPDATLVWTGAAALVLAIVSLADDRSGLPVGVRLAVHAITASALVWGAGLTLARVTLPFGGNVSLGALGGPLTVLGLVWMTNLYNFMDGMDGFAGSMTLVGFGTLAALLFRGGDGAAAFVALGVAAAAAGFLPFNAPPARIFMGDVGAVPIGFLAGALTLHGAVLGALDPAAAALAFAPFILDATWTLLRRAARGERVWRAHRSHAYQRLVLSGLGHAGTLRLEVGLMLAAAAAAFAWDAGGPPARIAVLAVVLAAVAGVGALLRARERAAAGPRG